MNGSGGGKAIDSNNTRTGGQQESRMLLWDRTQAAKERIRVTILVGDATNQDEWGGVC